jgi:hypothetical protein
MDNQKIKIITLRLPLDLWKYTHKVSIDREMSVNSLVIDCLKKYQSNREKRLEKTLDE